ncbi:odorant receptor 85f-like [Aethina tumida]|uniref:odorant receptor 85f-like n=1 Tax=Aethina tumida TaxID=116153 RepID=UPI00214855DE|nr:odorant receptor 85f-like [Aethina tumida]
MMEQINCLKMLKRLMMISGIWRLPLETKSLQGLYDKYSIVFQCYFYLFVLSLGVATIIVWNISMDMVVENLGVLILCVIMIIKIGICQTDTIKSLLRHVFKKEEELKASDDEESKQIYIRYQNVAFVITRIIVIHTISVGVSLLLTKYLFYWNMEKNQSYPNVTLYRKKPLPYITWLPFDSDQHFITAFVLHSISAFMGVNYNSVTAIFFLSVMIFICGQLAILQHKIRILDTTLHNSNWKNVTNELRALIVDHKTIIEYSEKFNNAVKMILLLDFTLNSLQVASLIFQLITMELNVVMIFLVIYLTLMVLQIFLLSWQANEVKEHSLRIADAIYDHAWHEQIISIRKTLLMMMMRSQKPLTLTIGPLYAITNSTSLTVF